MSDTNDMPNDFVSWVVSGNSNIPAGTRWDSEIVKSHLSAWQAATDRATAIERERCAKVVEAMTERRRMNSSQKPDCEYAAVIRQGCAG